MAFYCPAADGLYLKASGDVVCWNSPGENSPLATVRADDLDRFDIVHDVLHGSAMRAMRRDLVAHRNPFPFCASCSWGCAQDDAQWRNVDLETWELKRLRVLQVEPSFLCNLDCPACFPFAQRREGKKAKILQPQVLAKVVDDLVRAELPVDLVHLSGLGEPLMSPHFAEIVRYLKRRLHAPVHCHTNANFEFRQELLSCGLDSLTLAMDGAREETYGEYRKRGRFDRALRFARDLCGAKARTGLNGLNVAWKTVMFQWNSS
ncbi:MAG: radical SAM protein, partial [Planctomycetota bacterium]